MPLSSLEFTLPPLAPGYSGSSSGSLRFKPPEPVAPEDPNKAFRRLLRRARKKDQAACKALVEMFQTEIYRTVRLPLIGIGLQSVIDPMDICQAVFASFFARVVDGPYELREPNQMRQLLLTMARNKVTDEARRYMAQRRSQQRRVTDEDCLAGVPADQSTPSSIVGKRELLSQIKKNLTPEERYLLEQRGLGREWANLSVELGVGPEALRKKLDRALERVSKLLGLTA